MVLRLWLAPCCCLCGDDVVAAAAAAVADPAIVDINQSIMTLNLIQSDSLCYTNLLRRWCLMNLWMRKLKCFYFRFWKLNSWKPIAFGMENIVKKHIWALTILVVWTKAAYVFFRPTWLVVWAEFVLLLLQLLLLLFRSLSMPSTDEQIGCNADDDIGSFLISHEFVFK